MKITVWFKHAEGIKFVAGDSVELVGHPVGGWLVAPYLEVRWPGNVAIVPCDNVALIEYEEDE